MKSKFLSTIKSQKLWRVVASLALVAALISPVLPSTTAQAAANIYYVSNTASNGYVVGDDANDGLTKATPKLTISGAHTTASSGDTIIVNDGDYVGFDYSKGVTINPENDYQVRVTENGTVVLQDYISDDSVITLGALVLDGNNVASYGIIYQAASATTHTAILNGTMIININGTAIRGIANLKLNFVANNITTDEKIVFSSPLAAGSILFNSGNLTYSDVTNGVIIDGNVPITFNGTSLTGDNATFGIKSTSTSSVNYKNLNINDTGVKTSLYVKSSTAVNISGCNIISAAPSDGVSCIYTIDCPDAVVEYNTVNITDKAGVIGSQDGIIITTSGAQCDNPIIINNAISNNSSNPAVHLIMVGADSSSLVDGTHHHVNDAIIHSNNVTGGGLNTSGIHGIMIGNQLGGDVYNNKVDNVGIGILAKGTTGAYYYNNIVTRCNANYMYSKASTNTTFANNTLLNSATYDGSMASIGWDSVTGIYSTGINITNNIFYMPITSTYVCTVGVNNTAAFNTNLYYASSGTNFKYESNNYTTISEWQIAHESSLINDAPDFIDLVSEDYDIMYSSPCINSGTAQPFITSDYDGRTIIGIKDIGAYEYQPGTLISAAASGITMDKDGVTGGLYNGEVLTLGSDGNIEVIIEYGETVAYGSNTTGQVLNAIGLFSEAIPNNQTPGATYHWRPVVKNFSAISFGADDTYVYTLPTAATTLPNPVVVMKPMPINASATLSATVTDFGVASDLYLKFQYGTGGLYNNTSSTLVVSAPGTYEIEITGFDAGEVVSYRAAIDVGPTTVVSTGLTFTMPGGIRVTDALFGTILPAVIAIALFIVVITTTRNWVSAIIVVVIGLTTIIMIRAIF